MEMKHFSHKHPISLVEVKVQQQKKKYEGEKSICYGCLESILQTTEDCAYYCCTHYECRGSFFLHKSCAELPLEISHPEHQKHSQAYFKKNEKHSLILRQRPSYQGGSCECCVCNRSGWEGFTYSCSICEFNVDIQCVLRDDSLLSTITNRYLNHKSHEHPLTLKPRPAIFFCNACGTEDEDESYLCSNDSCPFWIHKSCALLPEIKESKHHDHKLSLEYSFPSEYQHFDLDHCAFCREKIYLDYWVYCCFLCRDFFHVKCVDANDSGLIRLMPLGLGFSAEDKSKVHHENCSVELPGSNIFEVSNIFVELTRDFLEKYGHAQELLTEIKHFSHEHPLILSIGHEHDVKELKYEEAMICDGCILPICDSYYSCEDCNYFLHASCAQLPKEFRHPRYPDHPLVLIKLQRSFSCFRCSLCELICNGFLYEGGKGYSDLDVKCAILDTVSVIKHENHRHQLVQITFSLDNRCSFCCRDIKHGFGCGDCSFLLDYKCALLPRCITHFDSFRVYKRDNHPLTLIYPPFIEHPDEFYCEICEEEIHPKYWLYHCLECDKSFHICCIVELEKYRNIKVGASVEVLDYHRHALKFTIRGGYTPFCKNCGADLYCQMAFECRDCNYCLCFPCCLKSVLLNHPENQKDAVALASANLLGHKGAFDDFMFARELDMRREAAKTSPSSPQTKSDSGSDSGDQPVPSVLAHLNKSSSLKM